VKKHFTYISWLKVALLWTYLLVTIINFLQVPLIQSSLELLLKIRYLGKLKQTNWYLNCVQFVMHLEQVNHLCLKELERWCTAPTLRLLWIVEWWCGEILHRVFMSSDHKKRVIRIITRSRPRDSCRELFKKLKILPFQLQCIYSFLLFVANSKDPVQAKF